MGSQAVAISVSKAQKQSEHKARKQTSQYISVSLKAERNGGAGRGGWGETGGGIWSVEKKQHTNPA